MVATIEHSRYYKGDMFKEMKITKITQKGVELVKKTANGYKRYILGFRKARSKKWLKEFY